MASCTPCRAELARQEVIRDAIVGAALYARATPSLRARIGVALPPLGGSRRRIPIWPSVAAAAAIVVGLWWFGSEWKGAASERVLVATILDAHLRSLQAGHLTDVASSDQHTVKPWFDGKLDLSPPVKDLAPEGFPLIGGRLDVVRGRTVATLVYGRRRHVVSLFVWPAEDGEASPARSGSGQGYQWIHWKRGGMTFWAVSDATAEDLEGFVRLLQG